MPVGRLQSRFMLPLAALAISLATVPLHAKEPPLTPAQQQMLDVARSLRPQNGKVPLPTARVTLDLGTKYDFYGPEDARSILVDIWKNPPAAADGVIGIVFPKGENALTGSWGAVLTYEETGYVEDGDAADADFDTILADMKQASEERNEERKSQGYPAMHIAGWAEPPKYDASNHSVVWARDLLVDGDQVHSLNYDLRTLGRSGVLSANFVAAMPDLAAIRIAAADFAQHASFDAGARYADYDPTSDRKAEYGIGGLVAAGVGVAAAKKLGLLAIMAKFLKPILIGLAALGASVARYWRRLFNRDAD
jgi:uncharacterized membrane-anchored protein